VNPAPYLKRISLKPGVESAGEHDFALQLPVFEHLDLELPSAVTFFVGENGTGKSTLMESIAEVCGLPVSGGGKNELADKHGPELRSPLGSALRPSFARRPQDSFFFRGEFQAHFATLLDRRRADPDFWGDPYMLYGGESLQQQSHGEAFLAMLTNRLESGLFLMDEPEAALSPQRQLTLLARMAILVEGGATQFIVATHSPVILTFPGATILSFDDDELRQVELQDTSHYQITKGILEDPERYWHYLLDG
jgi:predicted ATPase